MSNFLKFLLLLPFCLQANPKLECEEARPNKLPPIALEGDELDLGPFLASLALEEKVENGMSQLIKAAKAKQQEVEMLKAELYESTKALEEAAQELDQAEEDKTKLANRIRELKEENETYKLILGIRDKKSLEERLENVFNKVLKKEEC